MDLEFGLRFKDTMFLYIFCRGFVGWIELDSYTLSSFLVAI
jgi:hypothetical protein